MFEAQQSMDDAAEGEASTTPEQELREIFDKLEALRDELKAPMELDKQRRLVFQDGFLQGRAFEITRDMDEHPDWWDYGCGCGSCSEYD